MAGDGNQAGEGAEVAKLENLTGMHELFELAGFVNAAQKAGKSHIVAKKGKAGAFGIDEMLQHSNDPLPAPLLKLSADSAARAPQLFNSILTYQGETQEQLNDAQRIETIQKLLHQALKRPELKDELYMQLLKQTRGNLLSESRLRAWELLHILAATTPPGKDLVAVVSAYVNARAVDSENELGHIQREAQKTWNCLKRTTRAGPRRMLPSSAEISAALKGEKLNTIVFFMDNTFDDLEFEVTATVQEASGIVAAGLKLENYKSFTLFECRRQDGLTKSAVPSEPVQDEYSLLDDNRYIADILVELKEKNEKSHKEGTSRLVFKKRMFRKDDDDVDEAHFIRLSYIQCQQDFVQGHYPVDKDVASQLCALQMQAEHASTLMDDEEGIMLCVEKYVTKQLLMTRPRDEWKVDVGHRYKALEQYTKDGARIYFLQTLRSLPYGMSVFFPVKRVEDPIGLLPPKCIIGVNMRGLHFFRTTPKEYLHSAGLKDVIQFGCSSSAVFLKIKVVDVPHMFQFETRQGQEICSSLQVYISDVMTKKFTKGKGEGGAEGDSATNQGGNKKNYNPKYEQHLHQLQRALEDSKNQLDNMRKVADEIRQAKEKALADIEDSKAVLKRTEEARNVLQDQIRSLKKVERANAQEIELNKAKSAAAEAAAQAAGAELAAIDMNRYAQVEEELEITSEKLADLADRHAELDKAELKLTKEKELIESKVKRIETAMEKENKDLRERLEGVSGNVVQQIKEKDDRLKEMAEELVAVTKARDEAQDEIRQIKKDNNIMEMQDIMALQAEVEAKAKANAHILEDQNKLINDLEMKYKDEQVQRKRLFNALEDIKGKIRVYCRVRPLLKFEVDKGEKFALMVPNDVTVQHMWKDEKKPREYTFDQIFVPGTPQDLVFEDTRHCVQSAVDGYNVCIFAYGQTGSGKTFTIYGNEKDPGLTPRGVRELFDIIGRDRGRYACKVSYTMLELYQESVQDLLLPPSKRANPPKLEIKRDPKGMVQVAGSTVVDIRDYDHLMTTIDYGQKARHVSATSMNKESSRSHLIMSIVIESTNLQTQSVVKGKLTFVDLAGSERIKKSNAAGEQLKEAQAINKSLSALGNVISALATDNPHVPYRDHKLTMIMSDSLGGTAKTLMFVNCSPAEYNLDETQNSLNYALRVGKIKNLVKDTNKDSKDIVKLKKQIEYWKGQSGQSDSDRANEWKAYDDVQDFRYLEEPFK